jgi:acetylornithine deacetylase/succinyl-diaminopimelate desuccinylase-like protein
MIDGPGLFFTEGAMVTKERWGVFCFGLGRFGGFTTGMQVIIDYLKANQKRFLAELGDYLRFASVSAQSEHKQDLVGCAEWLVAHCRQIGLTAEMRPTAGHPIVVAKSPRTGQSGKRHFMVYGHYDVQPVEPLALWKTPPFEPVIQGDSIYARGSTDNKGQNFAHLKAVEAYYRTGTPLPCDLTFVLEGEEEVGSENLGKFLKANRKELGCEAVVISDTGMPSPKHPALTYALRGIVAFEIKVHGPARDLHSGVFGGAVENPAMSLCQLLARVRNAQGRVTIPGFYDGIVPLSKFERRQAALYPLKDTTLKKLLGAPELFGEKGFSATEQRSARPTFEINGLTSGYQGEGSKTIVPSWASAKITCRLVPGQDPEHVRKIVVAHLKKLCPPTVRLEIEAGHGAEAYLISPTSPAAQAALRALRSAFGRPPILIREGGSIPIVNQFKQILGADSLLLGLGLPDDNAHSPNEKFNLECFAKGQLMSAYLWRELSKSAEKED